MRVATFNAFRTAEKPVAVQFADGRTGEFHCSIAAREVDHLANPSYPAPIPDITAQLAPSKWGDAATFFFFSLGGLFLGGETGFLTGTASASRTIAADPGAQARIEKAFRNYQVDVLKRQVQTLESESKPASLFSSE